MPKCGNDECCSSTGIHEGITFGFGELDMYGYWEHPCRICAKDYDETLEERVQELKKMGLSEEDLETPEYGWVHSPAWPYEEKSK